MFLCLTTLSQVPYVKYPPPAHYQHVRIRNWNNTLPSLREKMIHHTQTKIESNKASVEKERKSSPVARS